MRHEQYKRLVENIKRDGQLESVPFCVRLPGEDRYKVLSGNHRVKAAKDAGLTHLLILYTDGLSADEQVAKQLAHNAIAGQDDARVLAELFESIQAIELKLYSGLDSKTLNVLERTEMTMLSELTLDWRQVTLTFLPEEAERLDKVLAKAREHMKVNQSYACFARDHERLLDAFEKIEKKHGVKNSATAMMLILDIFEKWLRTAERAMAASGRSESCPGSQLDTGT